MGKTAAFTAELLQDGHLSIPEKAVKELALKKGSKVKATIGTRAFDREGFLRLCGIWKDRSIEEIGVFQEILKERSNFGRGEVKL
jgi:hypothetical protein